MAQRDIVVKRKEGALTIPAPVLGTLSIPAIIGGSKGKKSDTSETGNLDGSNTYTFFNDLGFQDGDYIEQVLRIENYENYESDEGNIIGANPLYSYKEGVHFRIFKMVNSNIVYLDNNNLALSGGFDTYGIDFSQAPILMPPTIKDVKVIADKNGGLSAGTYTIRVYSVDFDNHVSYHSIEEQVKIESSSNNNAILIRWNKVAYVNKYIVKVYDGSKTYYKVVDRNSYSITIDGTSDDVSSYSFDNSAKQTPGLGANITLYYTTREGFYDVKLYSDLKSVEDDHGYGSQLYNVAKLLFDLNVPFIYLAAVEEESITGYLNALEKIAPVNDIHFVIPLTLNSTVLEAAHNQAISLSDPVNGQRERYVVTGIPYLWYSGKLNDFVEGHRSFSDKGKRIFIMSFDGGEINLDYWIDENGNYSYNVKVNDFEGKDITPVIGAAIAIGVYCSYNLTSLSLTEKNVPYVNFENSSWGDDVYIYLRNKGVMVVRNEHGTAVVDLDIDAGYPDLGVQDGQLPITRTEDYIKYDLRNKLKKYRGRTYPLQLRTDLVADYVSIILKDYMSMGLIADFNEGSINVSVTSDGKLHLYFRYTPVIIINTIEAEYEFDFIL